MTKIVFCQILAAVLMQLSLVQSDRLKDHIYTDFPPTAVKACFRRLNGTNVVGCTSEQDGNVGVLLYMSEDELADLEEARDQTGASVLPIPAKFGPFIVMVDPKVWGSRLMNRLAETGLVNGVILPNVKSGRWKDRLPTVYSDDRACPNSISSLYTDARGKCGSRPEGWNRGAGGGEGLLWQDWDVPVFYIDNENVTDSLYDCYVQYNRINGSDSETSWPLCSVEMKSRMYAAKDSESCTRRSAMMNTLTPVHYCDPLGDNNVVHYLSPKNSTLPDGSKRKSPSNSVILVVARLDTVVMFDGLELGFDSPTTGYVTLLTAAKLVKSALGDSPSYKPGVDNVVFLLLQGEAFDYIGSTSTVYDMKNEAFPFNISKELKNEKVYANSTMELLGLDNIKLIIEVGQLSNAWTSGNKLYAHVSSKSDSQANEIVNNLKKNGLDVSTSSADYLPPSSSLAFLKERPNLPVVMLNNFNEQYENPYYHSIYDNAAVNKYNYSHGEGQSIVQHLSTVSVGLAKTIIEAATGSASSTGNVQADPKTVNELLNCYSMTANCTMFKIASEPGEFPWKDPIRSFPLPQYVGVHSSYYTILTKQILQYFTGTVISQDKPELKEEDEDTSLTKKLQEDCLNKNMMQNVYSYIFLVGEDCYKTLLQDPDADCGECFRTTVSFTHAFSPVFRDGFSDYKWASGQYPTWTESIWKTITGRMFLQADPVWDHGSLGIGIIITVISFLLVFWLERRSSVLFPNPTAATPASAAPVSL